MTNKRCRVWGIIPARGGSKSIPKKNLTVFGGEPLINRVLRAGQSARSLERLICSTDSLEIAEHCQLYGVEIDRRPDRLATDDANIVDVLLELLGRLVTEGAAIPDLIALLQPTSPLLQVEHIDLCVEELKKNPRLMSSQTICQIDHNSHAYNQREVVQGSVRFRFAEERSEMYNKQAKPTLFKFGNCVVIRSDALFRGLGVFAEPSHGIEIDPLFSFDLDKSEDIAYGEYLLGRLVGKGQLSSVEVLGKG